MRGGVRTRIGAPLAYPHHAWFQDLHAVEEPRDHIVRAGRVPVSGEMLVEALLERADLRGEHVSSLVLDGHEAARRHGLKQFRHDLARMRFVGDVVQDGHQQDGDRLVEVQGAVSYTHLTLPTIY